MTALRRRLRDDRQRWGVAPTTQPCDLDAVTHRAQPDRQAPAQIRDEAIRQYCLHVIKEQQVAEST